MKKSPLARKKVIGDIQNLNICNLQLGVYSFPIFHFILWVKQWPAEFNVFLPLCFGGLPL